MKSAVVPLTLFAAMLMATPVAAGGIDRKESHRAVGRENDVRVDALLLSEVVRAGSPIALTYQIQNLTATPVAVAERVCSATYDADTQTITVAVGSEIPVDGELPRMATIGPGEKKTFHAAANLQGGTIALGRAARTTRRYLQIKVSVLRDLLPFRDLLERQKDTHARRALPLSDRQFEQWLESNDTIFLNELPVRFEARPVSTLDASQQRGARSGSQ